jgi:DNA-binding GntR family transcriptional regulator
MNLNGFSENLGDSTIPVRWALTKLTEDLIETESRRGYYVYSPGRGDISEVCKVIEMLELYAIHYWM